MDLKNKSILITGGTGSLGKALTSHILTHYPEIKKVVIFSRDEQKQFQMAQEYPSHKYILGSYLAPKPRPNIPKSPQEGTSQQYLVVGLL